MNRLPAATAVGTAGRGAGAPAAAAAAAPTRPTPRSPSIRPPRSRCTSPPTASLAQSRCYFNTHANLLTPDGPTGFPDDVWARQTITLRSTDRNVWQEAAVQRPVRHAPGNQGRQPRQRALEDVQVGQQRRDLGHLLRRRADRALPRSTAVRCPPTGAPGEPTTGADFIACSQIQVVYGGVNLTTPTRLRADQPSAESAGGQRGRPSSRSPARVSRICSEPPAMRQAAGVEEVVHLAAVDDARALGELHPELGERLPVAHADQLARAGLRAGVGAADRQLGDPLVQQRARPAPRRSARASRSTSAGSRSRSVDTCAAGPPSDCPARCRAPSRPARWPAWCGPAASRRRPRRPPSRRARRRRRRTPR